MSDATSPAGFWEDRYASADRIWSGRVNQTLADVASTLTPGRSLDLGCGEGGDVVWLAQQGWRATGVDISATATSRGRAAADAAGLDGQVRFIAADLATWTPDESYDLVSASFLQSPVELDRVAILRRIAESVVEGGRLLLVGHASPPPWARDGHHHMFVKPADELAALDLGWTVEIAEVRSRAVTTPSGEAATLDDSVVLLRR